MRATTAGAPVRNLRESSSGPPAAAASTRTSLDGSSSVGRLPPPSLELPSTTAAVEPMSRAIASAREAKLFDGRGDHPPDRRLLHGFAAHVVEQRLVQRRKGELVGSQRARQRMLPQFRDEFRFPDGESRLRPAEQLVAGEEDEVCARSQTLLRRQFVAEAECGSVEQRAGSQVVQERDAVRFGDGGDVRKRRFVGETNDAEVGTMHEQQRAGTLGDRALVVVGIGAVDRTYLDERGAALSEDVRYAEASADLARLAA